MSKNDNFIYYPLAMSNDIIRREGLSEGEKIFSRYNILNWIGFLKNELFDSINDL